MKVLFLDVDGVLNNHQWIEKKAGKFGRPPRDGVPATADCIAWDPYNVACLREVIDKTGAHIVISSSWRGGFGDQAIMRWREMFAVYGWEDAPVIGETPDIGSYVAKIRGDEVAAWLAEHPEVTHFACVDDDADFHPGQHLVSTDIRFGLTSVEAKPLIDFLTEI